MRIPAQGDIFDGRKSHFGTGADVGNVAGAGVMAGAVPILISRLNGYSPRRSDRSALGCARNNPARACIVWPARVRIFTQQPGGT
jgi:hypothetical protein